MNECKNVIESIVPERVEEFLRKKLDSLGPKNFSKINSGFVCTFLTDCLFFECAFNFNFVLYVQFVLNNSYCINNGSKCIGDFTCILY